jgi:glycine cleavage system H protein
MSTQVLKDYRYTKEHEWVFLKDDEALVGITDYAQDKLGDIVFVELSIEGRKVEQHESFCVIESVKAASDVYSPISGTIIEVNNELEENPALLNKRPYEEGYLAKFSDISKEQINTLMDAEAYKKFLESDG